MLGIIILHLYNLGIPGLYASIYNIKNKRNVKYTHIHKPSKIVRHYRIKPTVVSGLSWMHIAKN